MTVSPASITTALVAVPAIDLTDVAAGVGGFVIYGEDAGDHSGRSVASAGDINGDGYDDLIIGAADAGVAVNGTSNAGDSYVVFGKSGGYGASVNLAAVAAGSGGFVIHGVDANDNSGWSVASAGDFNGDGFDDLLIGAFAADAAGDTKASAGDSYVVFGKASGFAASIDLVDVAAGTGGFVIHGQATADFSGFSVASAGDVNGDGYDDLIIGAYRADVTVSATSVKLNAGASYVVFGNASGSTAAIDLTNVAAGHGGFVINGQDEADLSGYSVASAGDINGDGFADLIIGAYRADAAGNTKINAGDSYVVFGKATGFGASVDLGAVATGAGGFVIHGQDAGDQSGYSVASAGDINGDGFDDLIIGANYGDGADNMLRGAGDSYVVFGKATGFGASIDLAAVAAGTGGFVIHGQDVADYSAYSVASAGDINGDGYDDLIIGAPYADGAGNAESKAGDSYVVFGKAGGFGASIELSDVAAGTGGFVIHGQDADDASGLAVASAGDINGDGFDDLIIGARRGDGADNATRDTGESYVLYGKDFTGTVTHLGTAAANTLTGTSSADIMVAGLGDDTLSGAAGLDAINGGAGNDYITGGSGADRIDGGNGHDTADYTASAAAVTVNLASNQNSGGDATGDHLESIEDLLGSAHADALTGNGDANLLVGGTGNDTLTGGGGADTLLGGTGDDRYYRSTGDVLEEAADAGTDSVVSDTSVTLGSNFENLALSGTASIYGNGNTLANNVTGNSGDNLLQGGAGNDTLNGGNGIDTLVGGTGDDRYFHSPGDILEESLNSGTDLVVSDSSYTLVANLEKLSLSGNASVYANGNELANVLVGNGASNLLQGLAGNDTLSGGNGNDSLNGGSSNDQLTGGAGYDNFVFSASTTANLDTITDFSHNVDNLHLDDDIFTQFHAGVAVTGAQIYAGAGVTAAHDADDRLLYNSSTGALYYDADGNGSASSAVQFAVLGTTTHPTLTASDFLIVG